jgi:hypothetical protein
VLFQGRIRSRVTSIVKRRILQVCNETYLAKRIRKGFCVWFGVDKKVKKTNSNVLLKVA